MLAAGQPTTALSPDTNQDLIILKKDYYMPKEESNRAKITQLGEIYAYYNNTMIIIACLSYFVFDEISGKKAREVDGVFHFIFLIQFSLHLVVRVCVELYKEERLKKWFIANEIEYPKNFNIFDQDLKAEVAILVVCLSGMIYEIVFCRSFYDFLVA